MTEAKYLEMRKELLRSCSACQRAAKKIGAGNAGYRAAIKKWSEVVTAVNALDRAFIETRSK